METLNTKPLSSRLRERLSEPAMLDLTQRLIAIPSENPPGNQYEECVHTLFGELDRLGFDDPSGAISVHGVGGLWGVLAIGFFVSTRPGQLLAQVAMVSALLGFVLPLTYGLNWLLDRFYPQRIFKDGERLGLDMFELGAGAYPEWTSANKDMFR